MNAPLRKKQKRARSDEAKEQKKAAILAAARRLFEKRSYDALTVNAVASASRVAKGTVYLYFGTKEAIFLELLLAELEAWFAALAAPLAAVRTGDTRALTDVLARTIAERPLFRRLMALLKVTFEQNADQEAVRSFKIRGATAMAPTARAFEACLPELGPGGGFRLLIHLHALLVGVGQVADESEVVKQVLDDPMLAAFRVDFEVELRELVGLVLLGLSARAKETE